MNNDKGKIFMLGKDINDRWSAEEKNIKENFPECIIVRNEKNVSCVYSFEKDNYEYTLKIMVPLKYSEVRPHILLQIKNLENHKIILPFIEISLPDKWNPLKHYLTDLIYFLKDQIYKPITSETKNSLALMQGNNGNKTDLGSRTDNENSDNAEEIKNLHSIKNIKVKLPYAIINKIIDLYKEYPDVENGGRLIGVCNDLQQGIPDSISVYNLIPPGPRAKRSSVSLFQDGEWQDWLLDKIVASLPQEKQDLYYVGSFHHHCSNGYSELSSGDINGYRFLLDKYKPLCKVFLAILLYKKPESFLNLLNSKNIFSSENTDKRIDLAKAFIKKNCKIYLIDLENVVEITNDKNIEIFVPENNSIINNMIEKYRHVDMPRYLRQEFLKNKAYKLKKRITDENMKYSIRLNKTNDKLTFIIDGNIEVYFWVDEEGNERLSIDKPLQYDKKYGGILKWIIQEF